MCGTSTTLQIDEAMPDVSDVAGPKIAAIPSDSSSQTVCNKAIFHFEN
jgi:hypothetical protein